MAKRFKFRFDTMLKIRRQREDEKKRVVAARLREIGRAQDRIRSIESQTEQELQAMRNAQTSGRIDLQQAMRKEDERDVRARFGVCGPVRQVVVVGEALSDLRRANASRDIHSLPRDVVP